MPTKRTPIRPPANMRITPAAVATFRQMRRLDEQCRCKPIDWSGSNYLKHRTCAACEKWWKLNSVLVDELHLTPWQWPAYENPEAESPYPEGSEARESDKPDLEAQARYRLLEEAPKQQVSVS